MLVRRCLPSSEAVPITAKRHSRIFIPDPAAVKGDGGTLRNGRTWIPGVELGYRLMTVITFARMRARMRPERAESMQEARAAPTGSPGERPPGQAFQRVSQADSCAAFSSWNASDGSNILISGPGSARKLPAPLAAR